MPRYPVTVKVVEMRDDLDFECPVQSIGDTLTVNNGTFEGKICMYTLAQQISRIYGLVQGMPYRSETIRVGCPDKGKVVYEISRDPTKWWKDANSPLTDSEKQP
jgi:uncharacterized repeat protein (TIGR04076 family)